MIIVEGPDGSGKTTLAKHLAAELAREYKRAPTLSSTHGPDEAAMEWFEEEVGHKPRHYNAVYDRGFFVSELIYNLATPGRPLMADEARMFRGISQLVDADPIIIFCLPQWEISKRVIESDGRDRLEETSEDQLRKIHWAYTTYYTLWKNIHWERTFVYDFTSTGAQKNICSAIRELLRADAVHA